MVVGTHSHKELRLGKKKATAINQGLRDESIIKLEFALMETEIYKLSLIFTSA